jgi:alpha-1,2-mannosyltransferase
VAIRRSDAGRSAAIVAGVLIGVATLIKIFPGVLILWLLLRRRWTSALAAFGAMAVLVVATLPVIGLQPWLDYPTVLLNLGPPVDTRDTVAPIVWLSSVVSPAVARLLVVGAGVAIVAWTSQRRSEPVSFAVAVAVSVLIAPALYHHYLAILVLPMLLAIRSAPPIWWVALAYVLMFGGEQAVLGEHVWIVNRLLPTLGALLVLIGLVIRGTARSGRPSALGAG